MKRIAKIKASMKKFIEALGFKANMRVYRILHKYVHETKIFIKGLSVTRLRVHFGLSLAGEDEERDQRLYDAVNKFFDWDYETREKPTANGNCEFHEWLRKDNQARNDLEKYYLLSHCLSPKENERIEIVQRYRLHFRKELIPLDYKNMRKLHGAYKRQYRKEIREFRESKAQRIHIDLKEFTPLLKWLSFCFVIGGYIYAKLLYGHFGIAPSQFFSISDYLALSLDQIQPLAAAILGYVAGALHGYRNITTETRLEREHKLKSTRIPHGAMILLFGSILLAHLMGWLKIDVSPFILTVAVFVVTHDLVVFFSCKYFKNGLHASYSALFLIMFGANLYFNAEQKIKEIEAGRYEANFEIVVQSKSFTKKNAAYIGSNSRYLFLKTGQDKVEVLRLNQIDRISFQKN